MTDLPIRVVSNARFLSKSFGGGLRTAKFLKKGQFMKTNIPLGKRYPLATRNLTDADIKRLDWLFYRLNRMARTDENWNAFEAETDKILYGKD